eukprot:784544-Rhodomonas_salina.1
MQSGQTNILAPSQSRRTQLQNWDFSQLRFRYNASKAFATLTIRPMAQRHRPRAETPYLFSKSTTFRASWDCFYIGN